MYKIALNFEDGLTRFIDCKPEETVAEASYRQGVNLPLDCRDGACGTCKCLAESGAYTQTDYIDDALSATEAAAGYILTCKMRPESDCVVRVPASSAVCKTQSSQYAAQIHSVKALSPSSFCLTLEGEELSRLNFLPGQYVNLGVPGSDQHRAYSFSSLYRNGQVSFLIRNVPNGLMSQYLGQQAQAGDAIRLTGPLGSFYLREIKRPLLMLAGGTGLAPFLAMLEKIAEQGGSAQPVHLIYGVTHDSDVVGIEQLQHWAGQLANFSFALCVASPDSRHAHKGYVTQYIQPAQLNDGEVDIYLCGPPPMVEAVSRFLDDKGIQPRHFYHEKFSASQV
jgi:benzoate/toluate 1,2-dioxygenase reductase subunit